MAQRRRRQVRRNVLVFLTSLAIHVGLFFIAVGEFQFYPRPLEPEPAVQVELVPEPVAPIPPPPPIVQPKPTVTPKPTPPSPPPTPQPQPKPQPTPAPQPAAAKPAPAPSAPIKATPSPTPTPAPKPAAAPSPLTPPIPAPQPGPPATVSVTNAAQPQQHVVATRQLVLHKSQQPASALAPPVSIPGAIFAPPPQPGGPQPGGAAASASGGANAPGAIHLPGGKLPGFGTGLRGGALGCMNAAALGLTTAEKERCDAAYGMGTTDAPQMDRIDASKRAVIDQQAAQELAAQKYRDSTPAGSGVTPEAGQPHLGHAPGQ